MLIRTQGKVSINPTICPSQPDKAKFISSIDVNKEKRIKEMQVLHQMRTV